MLPEVSCGMTWDTCTSVAMRRQRWYRQIWDLLGYFGLQKYRTTLHRKAFHIEKTHTGRSLISLPLIPECKTELDISKWYNALQVSSIVSCTVQTRSSFTSVSAYRCVTPSTSFPQVRICIDKVDERFETPKIEKYMIDFKPPNGLDSEISVSPKVGQTG